MFSANVNASLALSSFEQSESPQRALVGHLSTQRALVGHLNTQRALVGHLSTQGALVGHLSTQRALVGHLSTQRALKALEHSGTLHTLLSRFKLTLHRRV